MRVLIIPEDFRKNQYILKPIFQWLFDQLGRPTARIIVCQDPRLGGASPTTDQAEDARLWEKKRRAESA